jgi:predicted DNA-binding transcriptional regulator YafY
MRRADRLFQLVQVLRRDRCTTAARLGEELGVSERTIYRDIRDLMLAGVPIRGEAGVGYQVPSRFELPPLMLSVEELEALVMGARMVEAWADPGLKEASEALLRKVESVLPEGLPRLRRMPLMVPDFHVPASAAAFLGELRRAIRESRKVRIRYVDGKGSASDRLIRPLGLSFFGDRWGLVAWCELRQEFRSFRPDRIQELQALNEVFPAQPGRTLEDYLTRMREELGAWQGS